MTDTVVYKSTLCSAILEALVVDDSDASDSEQAFKQWDPIIDRILDKRFKRPTKSYNIGEYAHYSELFWDLFMSFYLLTIHEDKQIIRMIYDIKMAIIVDNLYNLLEFINQADRAPLLPTKKGYESTRGYLLEQIVLAQLQKVKPMQVKRVEKLLEKYSFDSDQPLSTLLPIDYSNGEITMVLGGMKIGVTTPSNTFEYGNHDYSSIMPWNDSSRSETYYLNTIHWHTPNIGSWTSTPYLKHRLNRVSRQAAAAAAAVVAQV